jgi:shikimate dehydrogenase
MGNKKRCAVIGDPISHSLSPIIHQAFASQFNIELEYTRIEASVDNFNKKAQDFFSSGGLGLNVTVPNKAKAFTLCDVLSETSKQTKVVNTIHQMPNGSLHGDNTDPYGLIVDLEKNHQVMLRGKKILLIGAGGAAAGVTSALINKSHQQLTIANRTLVNADALVAELKLGNQARCVTIDFSEENFDIIINATSAGLQQDIPKISPSIIKAHTVCYDLSYSKSTTGFLDYCNSLGVSHCIDGWGMLVEQAAQSFEIWFNQRPDTTTLLLNKPR